MTGAQQSNVKAGDVVTVEYLLSRVGTKEVTKQALQTKAGQDGEDVIGPMLEQVATAVLTVALVK
jgi:ribosomal protein L21